MLFNQIKQFIAIVGGNIQALLADKFCSHLALSGEYSPYWNDIEIVEKNNWDDYVYKMGKDEKNYADIAESYSSDGYYDDKHCQLLTELMDLSEQESVDKEKFDKLSAAIKEHIVANRKNMSNKEFLAWLNRDGNTIADLRPIEENSSDSEQSNFNEDLNKSAGKRPSYLAEQSTNKKANLSSVDESASKKADLSSADESVSKKADPSLPQENKKADASLAENFADLNLEKSDKKPGSLPEGKKKSEGSLLDDFADPNLEQPSHMDPDD